MTSDDRSGEITRWLHRMGQGDADAEGRVFELLKDELRVMARNVLGRGNRDHTLQPSALVNELYVRIHGRPGDEWKDRQHFLAVSAKAMRCVLLDYEKAKGRVKRRPPGERAPLDENELPDLQPPGSFQDLYEALDDLKKENPVGAEIVERTYILGMSMNETARSLDVSLSTAERKWRVARAFLHARLK